MICQIVEMAGDLPVKASGCAMPVEALHKEAATVRLVGNLLDALSAVLQAEESLLAAALHSPATAARDLIETLRANVRQAIESAILAPAGVGDRLKLVCHVIDFDGRSGPLVEQAAGALADAVSAYAA